MLSVKINKKALKELDSLPPEAQSRILNVCRSMQNDPFEGDVRQLAGNTGIFRKRIGNYRIAFSVNFNDNEVLILKIGKRDKFYDSV